MNRRTLLTALPAAFVFHGAARAASAVELIMVEQPGCVWCARWNREIAPKYPKTEAGRTAPLRRIQLSGPLPADVELKSPRRITPTFILTIDGKEVERLEGYPGEDFFWPLVEDMIARNLATGEATASRPGADG